MKVSILVFLDMEFRLNFWIYQTNSPLCFNPCFSGYGIQTRPHQTRGVPWMGFNPCFSGYGIQTRLWKSCNWFHFLFQSLFFWIWNSDSRWMAGQKTGQEFQSLFFWIWNSDKDRSPFVWSPDFVSILVFLDMEFRQFPGRFHLDSLWFQSLFFWIWNSDWIKTSPSRATASSFNPCFSGYGIQTFVKYQQSSLLMSFNPCFSGYGIQTPMELATAQALESFNPCFSGYGIQT